jgi:ABC-type glycerol-3-phosphate transport system substrate-binding protein
MPELSCTSVLTWNVDLFDAEGMEHPPKRWKDAWTYDEFFEEMSKLVKDEGGKRVRWGAEFRPWSRPHLMDLIAPWGVSIIDPEDNRRCMLADPVAQEALEWCRSAVWDDNIFPNAGQLGDEIFFAERSGMIRWGPWGMPSISRAAKFRWNIAPLPQQTTQSTTICSNTIMGYAKTEYPDATWELLKFLMTPEWENALVRYSLNMPARISVLPFYFKLATENWPILEELEVDLPILGEAWDLGIGHTYPVWEKHAEAEEILQPMLDKVFKVGDTPVSAFEEACTKIEALHGL